MRLPMVAFLFFAWCSVVLAEVDEGPASSPSQEDLMSRARSGDTTAMLILGEMYEKEGGPDDGTKAIEWYSKAAEMGRGDAMYKLGSMYARGEDVPKDLVLGHMWLTLAAESHFRTAGEARATAAKSMTRSQIDEAQRLSRAWMEKHPKLFKAKR